MKENPILLLFEDWINKYNEGNGRVKDTYHQRMKGFIIALELSGKNSEADQCKECYYKLTGQ